MLYYVNTAESLYSTVTDTAQLVAESVLLSSREYVFTSNTDCWIMQRMYAEDEMEALEAPIADSDEGSMFVPAGVPVLLNGGHGDSLSVIRDADNGACTLTPISVVR